MGWGLICHRQICFEAVLAYIAVHLMYSIQALVLVGNLMQPAEYLDR
jgi:L-cystine uptake protein TcyP (sodium:dicarboxylate symporter family)